MLKRMRIVDSNKNRGKAILRVVPIVKMDNKTNQK